jgi:predicted anti-sigma-YlaC factor YlaD
MTAVGECSEIRQALGVYLLGAISPADRSTVERHLARCAACRAELAGLAALPGRLGSVPAADMARMAGDERGGASPGERPPDVPLQTLLDRAARVRRRSRWRRLAVAAAAVVIVGAGAVAGSRVLYSSAPRPPVPAGPWAAKVTGSDPQSGMSATVKYRSLPWGLALQVQVSGISPGTRCELQVVDASGQDVPAGGWMIVAGHAGAWYPASSPLPAGEVRGFLITTAQGKDLVRVSAI